MKKNVIINGYKREVKTLKENNEKEKTEKDKKKESGIITRESVGAVGALFSALAFFILCTRSLIFGGIGIAVNSFLLGLFGYLAYPILAAAIYLSVTSFIGKRFVRNRKAAAMIVAAFVCVILIVHTALTYSWNLSGYISRCFKEAAAGNHGIDSCTPAGWTGALLVYPLVKLTTRVGALVILSVFFLLFAYLAVYFWAGKVLPRRAGKKEKAANVQAAAPQPQKIEPTVPPVSPNMPYEPLGERNESRAPAPVGADARFVSSAASGQPAAYPPYADPYLAAAAPAVRQRPGVTLPNAAADWRQAPAGTAREPENAFSPFGTPPRAESVPRADANETSYREYQQSKEFLFGGTPAEIYRKNLIFDSNANVNKRPPADPNQPTVYGGSFADSYSAAYADSVNGGDEPPRPAKILTDNSRGKDLYNPYSLHDSEGEVGFGNSKGGYETPQPEPVRPFVPFVPEPAAPPPVYRPETEQTPSVRLDSLNLSESESPRVDPVPPAPVYGAEKPAATDPSNGGLREGRSLFGGEPPAPSEETSGSRPSFLDIFSSSNPNVYGQNTNGIGEPADSLNPRGDGFDRGLSDRGSSRGLFDDDSLSSSRPEGLDTARTTGADRRDRLSPFDEDGRGREDDVFSSDKKGIFDEEEEDPYSLRSDFSDRNDRISRESEDSSDSFPSSSKRSSRMESGRETGGEGRDIFGADRRGNESDESAAEKQAFQSQSRPTPPPKPRVHKPYQPAPLDYFDCKDVEPDSNAEEVENTKQTILETLEAFKVTDSTIASVTYGPTVTRYNVVIPRNISARKVVALDQEIAMNLYASKGVNIYPNFEDGAVSIEVPNKTRQFVQLGCMLTGDGFVKSKPTSLVFAMGKDVGNRKVYGDICKMTHLLVAGASGSGKSVFLRSLIISLIVKYSPQELRLILIDPKKTEFVIYDHLPHLMINEIITDINKVIQSLNWAIGEMNRRYGLFEQMSRSGTYVVNIDEYNANLPAGEEKLAKIVIIVDELADLMLAAKKEVEDRIQNLTQKSRAAGIHLIIATQRPSADVITGVIKGNLPTRIAFSVASDVDSRVILDASGAQKLLGFGDLLYLMAGMNTPTRVQGASISSEDAQKVVNFIKANNEAEYDESASAFINNTKPQGEEAEESDDDSVEEVYIDALRYIIQSGSASISMIQRKCSVGYNKAGKIIEWMEDMGYISAFDGAKARKVLITKEEFEVKYGPL